jgi:hypothetical protein
VKRFTDKFSTASTCFRPQSRPSADFSRHSGNVPQIPVSVHVVNQVHQSDLRSSPRLPDTPDQRPDLVFHPSEDMFDSCANSGFLSIPLVLKFTQRMVSIRLSMNMAFQFTFLKKLFGFFRTIGAIRPDPRSCIVFIKDVFHLLTVMNTRWCHRIFTDKLSHPRSHDFYSHKTFDRSSSSNGHQGLSDSISTGCQAMRPGSFPG